MRWRVEKGDVFSRTTSYHRLTYNDIPKVMVRYGVKDVLK